MTHFPGYPATGSERDRWILSQRPARNQADPFRPYAFLVEDERSASGEVVPVATLFLTNRECPWRCVMCDLWRNTLIKSVPVGAIPRQIDYALAQLPSARQIKLYNSGSFFDHRAIPEEDYPAIADRARRFERTIVESHPALIGDACVRFRDLVATPLEIAMGLETAHPEVLDRLNKRMSLDQFAAAGAFLQKNDMDLRVFLLVHPPFMPPDEAMLWARRSVEFAFDCGATAVTLISTRAANGAMETLMGAGEFVPPPLETLEAAVDYGVALQRGRVFADTWDLRGRSNACIGCNAARIDRLQQLNLTQRIPSRIECDLCGARS